MDSATIGQRIRTARKRLGMSQHMLAELIGSHQQTINKIERGQIEWSRYFKPIEQALKMQPGSLNAPETLFVMHAANERGMSAVLSANADDIPVFLSSIKKGGLQLGPTPVAFLTRPTPLARVRDGYAFLLSSDVHAPAYEVGDTLLVNQNTPPMLQADVILRKPSKDGETLLALGKLVRMTDASFILVEYKTGQERSFRMSDWPVCHRVVGKYNR